MVGDGCDGNGGWKWGWVGWIMVDMVVGSIDEMHALLLLSTSPAPAHPKAS